VLLREYQASLGLDLEFQDFSREIENLPGGYGPPDGVLLLATLDGTGVGCVGVRRWDASQCEMKRLYVRPAGRGQGLGRALAQRAIAEAVTLGYTRMLLDTLPEMAGAQALYSSLGFADAERYRDNPVPGTRFMARRLR
jgi:GNAT superfamily N-acetyltransferase